jgi:hypothetical protein
MGHQIEQNDEIRDPEPGSERGKFPYPDYDSVLQEMGRVWNGGVASRRDEMISEGLGSV